MSTKVIYNNEIKDKDVDTLLFNVDPSCGTTANTINGAKEYKHISINSTSYQQLFIDKHSIDNLILALQEAKRLWSEDDE